MPEDTCRSCPVSDSPAHGFVVLSCFLYLYWAELLNWIKRGFSFCTRILIMFMKRRKFTWLGRKIWAENKRVRAKLINPCPRALSHPYGNYNGTLDDPPIRRVFIYVPAPGKKTKAWMRQSWLKSAPFLLSQSIKRLISCLIIGIIVFYVGFCWGVLGHCLLTQALWYSGF